MKPATIAALIAAAIAPAWAPTDYQAHAKGTGKDATARTWTQTEMSCYTRGAKTRRHIAMWGTRCVFGHPDRSMIGHWIRVRVLSTGHTFEGVVCGTMGRHVKPSKNSACPRRVLDLAFAGWEQQFPGVAHGVMDVEYVDLGKRT